MSVFEQVVAWFSDPANWQGPAGVPTRLGEHLAYSVLAMLIASAIALPIGAVLGHLNRGEVFVLGLANTVRALPTFGLLTLLVIATGTGILPPLVALIILAVPPILVNTFEGMRGVNPTVTDAARGIGLTSSQVLLKVRLPSSTPLIMLGVRLATIQVISTATIAAYVGLGGLGRYVFDGLARRQLDVVISGSILVAVLAVTAETALILITRLCTSPGVTRRSARRVPPRSHPRKPQQSATSARITSKGN